MSHRIFLKSLALGFAAVFFTAPVDVRASAPVSLLHNTALATGTVSLSGGTLHRAGQPGEVFGPLRVTSKSLRDFGTAKDAGQFFLFEDVFRTWEADWAGFTFTITALPETSGVIVLSALLAVLFCWPERRRLIKDFKSIVGLRPPGRVRIEAYRRRANDEGRPRVEVWTNAPADPAPAQQVAAAKAAKVRERVEPEPAGEPVLAA